MNLVPTMGVDNILANTLHLRVKSTEKLISKACDRDILRRDVSKPLKLGGITFQQTKQQSPLLTKVGREQSQRWAILEISFQRYFLTLK